ncbi:hypothetical protein PsYK624_028840 [Phanerochaete sordida]|uniref:Uncharacterized protein n=1 Tax=Phanerochaete sordida TaxID=48140 RepID=A0A9P3L930_9APHY|nr:hypothetical protein PsYK624_028840 [Phanerochaete sordida]
MLVQDDSRSTRTVSRSGSFLGTIKGLWPAKLFGWSGDSPDTPGKRKGVEESYEAEEGQRSSKRPRVGGSPVRETIQPQVPQRQPLQLAPLPTSASGYLEPPGNFFGPTKAAAASRQGGHVRATSLAPSTRPLQASGSMRGLTAGPSAGAQPLGRTMSMDPPNRYRPNYGAPKPMPLSRDVSMDDGSFEKTLSRSPTLPFRMRTSLTPQPSGVAFGPEPPRRERNGSEPPPLAQLIDKPVFVKAPSETPPSKPSTSQAQATLGALAEAKRTGKAVQRSHSSLNIGADSATRDVTAAPAPEPVRPINTTEKMLRELEVYKTPLLPTRLRGTSAIPDMFKAKKGHGLVLMHDRDSKARLGSSDKPEDDEDAHSSKPYAGRGGMKKLLARRRQEEEEEKEKERAAAIETDEEEALRTSQKAKELDEKLVKGLNEPLEPEPEREPPKFAVGGRPQSSLRVGRTKSSRNHIDRPKAKGKGGGRFSALYEYEEEDEDAMDDGSKQESPKKLPAWAPPPGFSFAKDTAPLAFDTVKAKEAPISSLPFSLTSAPPLKSRDTQKDKEASKPGEKPTAIPLPRGFSNDRDVPHSSPPVTVAAESLAVSAPAPLTPLLSAVPQIALIPASPGPAVLASAPRQPAAEQLDASVTGKGSSAVPNFFSGSALLNKTAQVSLPANFSFGIPSSTTPTAASSTAKETPFFSITGEKKDGQPTIPQISTPTTNGHQPAEAGKAQSPFSGFGAGTSSIFSKAPEPAPAKSPEEAAKEPPVVAAPTPTSAFSFGKPAAAAAADKPAFSGFSFGAPKPAEVPSTTPSPLPFAFGAGAQSTKPAETATSDSRPTTGDGAAKNPLFFGASSTAPAQPSPFGTPSPTAAEPPKSPFPFGSAASQPSAAAPAAAPAPAVEAPKSMFSGFSFGQSSTPAATAEPPKASFSFSTPTPATPTTEKQQFVFGKAAPSTPAPAGSTLFGTPAPNGSAAPTTPPKKEEGDLSMMDESSPSRGSGMEVNGGKAESMALNGPGFSLAPASTSSPFGQPAQSSSLGFAFGSNTGAASPFGAKPEAAKPTENKPASGFMFGQPGASTGFPFPQKPANGGAAPSTPAGFAFGKPAESAAPSAPPGFAFTPKPAEPTPAPGTPTGFVFGPKPTESNAAASTGGFAFGAPPTPTTTGQGFAFGAPQLAPSTSFGAQATSATSTTPSPNPFSQPAQPAGGFGGFGVPTPTSATAPSQGFAFSSQPASPAVPSSGLPGQNGAAGFPFGSNAAPASSPSPFAPTAALPSAGGPVFTMGAAPPPTPGGSVAGRQIKKLPARRGGKR